MSSDAGVLESGLALGLLDLSLGDLLDAGGSISLREQRTRKSGLTLASFLVALPIATSIFPPIYSASQYQHVVRLCEVREVLLALSANEGFVFPVFVPEWW